MCIYKRNKEVVFLGGGIYAYLHITNCVLSEVTESVVIETVKRLNGL